MVAQDSECVVQLSSMGLQVQQELRDHSSLSSNRTPTVIVLHHQHHPQSPESPPLLPFSPSLSIHSSALTTIRDPQDAPMAKVDNDRLLLFARQMEQAIINKTAAHVKIKPTRRHSSRLILLLPRLFAPLAVFHPFGYSYHVTAQQCSQSLATQNCSTTTCPNVGSSKTPNPLGVVPLMLSLLSPARNTWNKEHHH
jgi:hypothetical protein